MEYLKLGTILDSFGLDGTIKVYSTTNNKKMRYKKGTHIFLYNPNNESREEYEVISFRTTGQFDFVKLNGVSTPEKEKKFKGFEIHTIKDRNDLDVGYYFYSDLEGCNVLNGEKEILGKVSKVEEFPAQITLRVQRKGKPDFFVPFIKQFIINVDIENKEIIINVIEGMLWK